MGEKKVKVISQGYTLNVTSWENDGDNYRTKSKVYQNLEEVKAVVRFCRDAFVSCNNGKGGVGNWTDDEEEAETILLEHLHNHPQVWNHLADTSDASLLNFARELMYALLGGSEYYYCRVFSSCTCTYSPTDVYLTEVKID